MGPAGQGGGGLRGWTPQEIALHVAADLPAGGYVNLGIGMPTLVAAQLPPGKEVVLHSENGLLGLGPPPPEGREDPELIDAGKNPATLVPGGSYFSHAESFAMIRGGHIDVSVMGAFQVSQDGDLANWAAPGDMLPAVGGAMDLAAGAKRVVIMTTHTTRAGDPKLVARCTYPLTAGGVVRRVYTDLMTADISEGCFVVRDMAPGVSMQLLAEVTGGRLASPSEGARP